MQDDEPRRPGAARPSLLSAAAQPEAARNSILNDLDGGKTRPAGSALSGAKPRLRRAALGGMALAVVLLGGAAAWVAMDQGGPPDTTLAQAAASSQAVAASDPAAASPAASSTPLALAAPVASAAPEKAPGNSDDLVAALAAPSAARAAPAAAAIQDETPAQREQSLRDMLNAPAAKTAAPPLAAAGPASASASAQAAADAAGRAGNGAAAEPAVRAPARAAGLAQTDGKPREKNKSGGTQSAREKARLAGNPASGDKLAKNGKSTQSGKAGQSGKAAPAAKTVPAQAAPDSDVALLAALVAHTHAGRPAKQPESLSAKLKQCGQLAGKGAEQCRARTCAGAKDDPLCKPAVTAATEGASS